MVITTSYNDEYGEIFNDIRRMNPRLTNNSRIAQEALTYYRNALAAQNQERTYTEQELQQIVLESLRKVNATKIAAIADEKKVTGASIVNVTSPYSKENYRLSSSEFKIATGTIIE